MPTPTPPLQNGAADEQGTKPPRSSSPTVPLLLLALRAGALLAAAASAAALASSGAALLARAASFRLLLAADAVVAVYAAAEAGAAAWEAARGATPLPEALQLWFDFGHDQGIGYLALAAAAAAARDAAAAGECGRRAGVAVALGFVGFAMLAAAALVTGFRVACFLATGSRSRSRSPVTTTPAVFY
ncbi:hypothetical protein BS78_08G111300 [Paspalum vaginatum]|nr:hypothetical protein BS78_08G111300 [Paspalum vaginatum]